MSEGAIMKVTIPNYRAEGFWKAVGSINRKFAQLGHPEVVAETIGTSVKKFRADGREHSVECTDVAIKGGDKLFSMGDFQLVGRIDYRNKLLQYRCLNKQYESELLAYDVDKLTCEHCKVNRHRNSYYVIRDFDGRSYILGSTCVNDFFGWKADGVLVNFVWLYDALDKFSTLGDDSGDVRKFVFPLAYLVDIIDLFTDRFTNWRKGETMDDIREYISSTAATVKPQDVTPIKKYWEDKFAGGVKSSFDKNVQNILGAGYANWNSLGLACYAIFAAKRDEVKPAALDASKVAEHALPEYDVGEVVKLKDVDVIKCTEFESKYGLSRIVTMRAPDGIIYKTFTSGSFGLSAEITCDHGGKMSLEGKFVRVETYRGKHSLVLNYCKEV